MKKGKKVGWIALAVVVVLLAIGAIVNAVPAEQGTHLMQSLGFGLIVLLAGSIGTWVAARRRRAAVPVRTDED